MKNTPAFPTQESYGMTLRDYFAAKAMQGMMADPTVTVTNVAYRAYILADAMLIEKKDTA
jgi:hypothetical protein